MSDQIASKTTPQFSTAEYAGTPGTDRCKICNQPITGVYYRINNAMACGSCADQAKRSRPQDSHAAFVRGVLFGVGGAILGLVLYSAVGIITGLMIGYVSLAVGFIVGKAINLGSRGIGGRRYQIVALLLTYAAVSLAAIPIGISISLKQRSATRVQQQKPPAADPSSKPDSQAQPASGPANSEDSTPQESVHLGALLGRLLLLGLASPFLELQDPVHGIIGLVILFVGLNIAWKITSSGQKTAVTGPYQNQAPASS
jgi:predicted lipid-binding transport protein (Tim44 family)